MQGSPNATDGYYRIVSEEAGYDFTTWCDMSGGGWTLVGRSHQRTHMTNGREYQHYDSIKTGTDLFFDGCGCADAADKQAVRLEISLLPDGCDGRCSSGSWVSANDCGGKCARTPSTSEAARAIYERQQSCMKNCMFNLEKAGDKYPLADTFPNPGLSSFYPVKAYAFMNDRVRGSRQKQTWYRGAAPRPLMSAESDRPASGIMSAMCIAEEQGVAKYTLARKAGSLQAPVLGPEIRGPSSHNSWNMNSGNGRWTGNGFEEDCVTSGEQPHLEIGLDRHNGNDQNDELVGDAKHYPSTPAILTSPPPPTPRSALVPIQKGMAAPCFLLPPAATVKVV